MYTSFENVQKCSVMKIRFTIFKANCLEGISAEEFEQENCPIYGFFEMQFNCHREGEYFDFPVPDDYLGGESLSYWFESLLEILHLFQNKKTNYATIRVIECTDRWIEIKKIQDKICLNVAIAKDAGDVPITSRLRDAIYEPPLDTIENYDSFYREIIRAVTEYLSKIKALNPNLMKTSEVVRISNYLHDLEN